MVKRRRRFKGEPCALCGRAHAATWFVPARVWRHYIPCGQWHLVLCFKCWKSITTARDNRSFEAAHGRPVGIGPCPIEWETGKPMVEERFANALAGRLSRRFVLLGDAQRQLSLRWA